MAVHKLRCLLLLIGTLYLTFLWSISSYNAPLRNSQLSSKPQLKNYITSLHNLTPFENEKCLQCALWEKEARTDWDQSLYLMKLYLETVKTAVTGYSLATEAYIPSLDEKLEVEPFSDRVRFNGLHWPRFGYTMVGVSRLNILQMMLEDIIFNNVPGDFMECGVWRGGASLFARAVFVAYGTDRKVILADSFAGLPKGHLPKDLGVQYHRQSYLAVDEQTVKDNIRRFGIFDENAFIFIVGYFNDTMPGAHKQLGELSVLRIDGDMYESCFDVINAMYAHVSVGGYVFVDDWRGFGCKDAVLDFRKEVGCDEQIFVVPHSTGAYWKKEKLVYYDQGKLFEKYIKEKLKQ